MSKGHGGGPQIRQLRGDLMTANGSRALLRDVTFDIGEGEAVGLVGESGSGKSMTARAISRLLPSSAQSGGSVGLRGDDVRDKKREPTHTVSAKPGRAQSQRRRRWQPR